MLDQCQQHDYTFMNACLKKLFSTYLQVDDIVIWPINVQTSSSIVIDHDMIKKYRQVQHNVPIITARYSNFPWGFVNSYVPFLGWQQKWLSI